MLTSRKATSSAIGGLAPLLRHHELIITHGNGPQVGVLAVKTSADPALPRPYPFDALGEVGAAVGYRAGEANRRLGGCGDRVAVPVHLRLGALPRWIAGPGRHGEAHSHRRACRGKRPGAGRPRPADRDEGHAAGALLDAARGADLLVVGSRGHGGFAATLLGSVTIQCVLHAHCPVLVFRDGTQAAAGGGP